MISAWGDRRVRLLSRSTVRVSGHFLETDRDDEGGVVAWRLLCGACLAPLADRRAALPSRPRPGLPIDGALTLPELPGWPAATLAWGLIHTGCDHPTRGLRHAPPGPSPRVPEVSRPRPRSRPRVVFRSGVRRSVDADPVLVPGGLWLAVADGEARWVRSEAFGVTHGLRVDPSPADPCR